MHQSQGARNEQGISRSAVCGHNSKKHSVLFRVDGADLISECDRCDGCFLHTQKSLFPNKKTTRQHVCDSDEYVFAAWCFDCDGGKVSKSATPISQRKLEYFSFFVIFHSLSAALIITPEHILLIAPSALDQWAERNRAQCSHTAVLAAQQSADF